jgi:hypothetical protein
MVGKNLLRQQYRPYGSGNLYGCDCGVWQFICDNYLRDSHPDRPYTCGHLYRCATP